MPKEGKLDNYTRSSQPTCSHLHFAYVTRDLAVLNSFSQNKAASLPTRNSLATTDFYSYINSGYVSKCYLRKINKWIIQYNPVVTITQSMEVTDMSGINSGLKRRWKMSFEEHSPYLGSVYLKRSSYLTHGRITIILSEERILQVSLTEVHPLCE